MIIFGDKFEGWLERSVVGVVVVIIILFVFVLVSVTCSNFIVICVIVRSVICSRVVCDNVVCRRSRSRSESSFRC